MTDRFWCKRWLRQRDSIPDALWSQALTPVPYIDALGSADHSRLRALVLRFLRHKTFEGAAGLIVTDDMRVRIAVQACLLILNLDFDYYAGWRSIIVYPGDFRVTREIVDSVGVVHHATHDLAGESWEHGPVILSWDTVFAARQRMAVVLHEFAHKIDMRDGVADGCPPLPPDISPQTWARDFSAAFARLHVALEHHAPLSIDAYAAETPAEFFAVASETFFLQPGVLVADFPEVYRQLRAFYRQDPDAALMRR
jgi:Mlc titration factor MtfA (ptsG expression regulator)